MPQLLTVLAVTAVIVFAVVIVPKLGRRRADGFRNVIIILFANLQASSLNLPMESTRAPHRSHCIARRPMRA